MTDQKTLGFRTRGRATTVITAEVARPGDDPRAETMTMGSTPSMLLFPADKVGLMRVREPGP
jgi:hypothetical protein